MKPDPSDRLEATESPAGEKVHSRRALATRAALLRGARAAFTAAGGFTETSISDIVAHSGSSTGSLYNQFGGKEEIYLALHQDYCQELSRIGQAAAMAATQSGMTDPVLIYLEGVRAFLRESWQSRDLTELFLGGDTPAHFHSVLIELRQLRIDENISLLGLSDQPNGEALSAAITGALASGQRFIASCETATEAAETADYLAALVHNMIRP